MQLVRLPEAGVPKGPPDVRPVTAPVSPLKLATPVTAPVTPLKLATFVAV